MEAGRTAQSWVSRLFCVCIAGGTAACGARSGLDSSFGGHDAGGVVGPGDADTAEGRSESDAEEATRPPDDASPSEDSGPSCSNACAPGDAQCDAGGVSTCVAGANDCP